MATPQQTDPSAAPPLRRSVESSQEIHFSLLTDAEQASFRAGLRTRIRNRLHEAVTAPTRQQYHNRRDEHLQPYQHLAEVQRLEASHAVEPVTDDMVLAALDEVERDLGESWRHQLEHAINVSHSARQITARLADAPEVDTGDPGPHLLNLAQWMTGWMLLNWSIDCVMVITDQGVVVQPEVIEAVFEDLRSAADTIYMAACEAYDLRFGDPDEQE